MLMEVPVTERYDPSSDSVELVTDEGEVYVKIPRPVVIRMFRALAAVETNTVSAE